MFRTMKQAFNNTVSLAPAGVSRRRVVLGIDPGSRLLGYAVLSIEGKGAGRRSGQSRSRGSSRQGDMCRLDSGTLNLIALAKKRRTDSRCQLGEESVSQDDITMSERLAAIWDSLSGIVAAFQPTELAIEDLFNRKNIQSLKKLSQARGVVLALAGLSELPVSEYSPASVKQSVVGHGRAKKEQIRAILSSQLDMPPSVGTDESDAIAIALCHIRSASQGVSTPTTVLNTVEGRHPILGRRSIVANTVDKVGT